MNKKTGIAGAVCSVAVIIGLVVANGNVRTSQRGLEIIGNAEACRLEPYLCPANVWTDGIGNTHGVNPGARKTVDQVAADWERNILDAEKCVIRYANGDQLPQGAFDAAVSVTFNLGCPAMQKSTMFMRFRHGRIIDACNQFPRWVYANGKILRGLEIRREKERELCLSN
ncbi:lysozyme [Serratia fonticola]|uniref:Lysozyme n=1 Tax=Serratia fonticola TaxID=47917 RepID=A0AAW3WQW2_SERFO|nr:lysozyme [Serratia fonticola]MBC3213394.1 lysozyme [Serratia fonticola]NYA14253.1 lysozyme [Serratia fonticola]NYA33895.1 lysozyme [Serratia fonticola]